MRRLQCRMPPPVPMLACHAMPPRRPTPSTPRQPPVAPRRPTGRRPQDADTRCHARQRRRAPSTTRARPPAATCAAPPAPTALRVSAESVPRRARAATRGRAALPAHSARVSLSAHAFRSPSPTVRSLPPRLPSWRPPSMFMSRHCRPPTTKALPLVATCAAPQALRAPRVSAASLPRGARDATPGRAARSEGGRSAQAPWSAGARWPPPTARSPPPRFHAWRPLPTPGTIAPPPAPPSRSHCSTRSPSHQTLHHMPRPLRPRERQRQPPCSLPRRRPLPHLPPRPARSTHRPSHRTHTLVGLCVLSRLPKCSPSQRPNERYASLTRPTGPAPVACSKTSSDRAA